MGQAHPRNGLQNSKTRDLDKREMAGGRAVGQCAHEWASDVSQFYGNCLYMGSSAAVEFNSSRIKLFIYSVL
jgi:hypothetical protein